ncbi:hypothetical protein ACH4C2_11465 [Streptomyces sp. NPDC018057]|uniref:hypothetical protein n=1 Tax=unclassified Streptomyces TaxID=2593676 RepID=UPI0037930BE5
MRASLIRMVSGGLIAAAAVAVPAAQAFGTTVTVSGRVSQWAPAAGDSGKTGVKDLGSKQWVKGEYNRQSSGSTKKTLWNKSGKDTTVYSASGSKITKIHACEEHDWDDDICTGWTSVG